MANITLTHEESVAFTMEASVQLGKLRDGLAQVNESIRLVKLLLPVAEGLHADMEDYLDELEIPLDKVNSIAANLR